MTCRQDQFTADTQLPALRRIDGSWIGPFEMTHSGELFLVRVVKMDFARWLGVLELRLREHNDCRHGIDNTKPNY